MKLVREVLEKVARVFPRRLQEPQPVVLLVGFGSSSVDWEVSVWIDDPWIVNRAKSDLYEAIWWALKDADIPIAFPQLDVHLDPPVIEAIQRAS
jgi:small-conductance mechanosensitive channel